MFASQVGVYALTWATQQDSLGAALGGVVEAAKAVFADFSLSKYFNDTAINIVLGWFGFQVG